MAGKKKDIAGDTPKWEDVPEIPKEEQPYPLPEGWKWVKVGDILNLQAGKNITSKFINSIKTADYQYPCYGGNGVRGYVKEFNHNGEFFIIGRQGALCGNIHHVCGKFYATEHAVVVTSKTYYVDINYAGNYLEFMNLNQYATATAQPGLAVSNILKLPFLLPPLSIQQRIVTTIESLFSKLDEAAEKVQAVLDGHETRKQAILQKAFSGELTKKWREENGVSLDSWEVRTIDEISKFIKAGGDKPEDFQKNKDDIHSIPVVANGIDDNGVIGYTSFSKNYKNTLTVAGRGTIGFPCLRDYDYFPVVRLIVIFPDLSKITNRYLYYLFVAFPEQGIGSSIPQLTVPMVKSKKVPVCSIKEQNEIVKILVELIVSEDQLRDISSSILLKINSEGVN